jgi:predicted PurR-regulated permease PerM
VSDWGQIFLGTIAVATLIMALMQIGAVVVAAKVARQTQEALGHATTLMTSAQQTLTSVREEIRPMLAKATAVVDEASKTAALATAQAQKIDRLVSDLAKRVDETSVVVQRAVVTPAREGLAIVAGFKAALTVLRRGGDWGRRSSRSEEEDPLFIG